MPRRPRSPCASSPHPRTRLLRHRRRRACPRVDRQGGLRRGSRVERDLQRHGIRRQRALHPAGRGRRPRRGHRPHHPHRHDEHAHPRHRLGGQPQGRRPAPDHRLHHGLRRRRRARQPTPVPSSSAEDEHDREWQESAVTRIGLRDEIAAAMAAQTYSDAGTAPRVVLRFLAAPTDVNWGGKVHGGIVMRWIDEAAHVLATRWTGAPPTSPSTPAGCASTGRCGSATSSRWRRGCSSPGTSSMHISVHVRSGDPADRRLDLTTHSLIVFVPLDSSAAGPPGLDAGQRRGRRPARPRAPARAMRNQVDADSTPPCPTFSPDPGTFTFAPEPLWC